MTGTFWSAPSSVGDSAPLTPDVARQAAAPAATPLQAARAAGPKIMIVDDEPINAKIVQKYLHSAGHEHFVTTNDARDAVALALRERPDVVVLDIVMPQVSGLEILSAIRQEPSLRHVPVLILSAANDADIRVQALLLGATDFVSKPVQAAELVARVRNMLIVKEHFDHLLEFSDRLQREVRLRTAELASSRQEVIQVLAIAAEYRDQETGNHVLRVGRYAGIVARELGVAEPQCELIEQAAILHDVGKIGIPDGILLKQGELEPGEIELMRHHCDYGMHILSGRPPQAKLPGAPTQWAGRECQSPILKMAGRIAMSHHERWDGSGYPLGLQGESIPLEGRIVAVADVFDSLHSARPYKPALPLEKCLTTLEAGRESHFDPRVLDAFLRRLDQVIKVALELGDSELSLT